MLYAAMLSSFLNLNARVRRMTAGCAVLLCMGVCGAQDLRYLSQQAWSTEEGLPQSSVHSVAQTRDGYLWIATEGGLARFDGERFKVFDHADEITFRSDDVCCLVDDVGDGLWIGTADGVVRMQQGRISQIWGGRWAAVCDSAVDGCDGRWFGCDRDRWWMGAVGSREVSCW
jgi:hypothetical protein